MKKEEILAGVCFKVRDNNHDYVFQHQYNTIVRLVGASVPLYYANIEIMNDAYMVVYATFFGRLVKRRLYYKNLIKA